MADMWLIDDSRIMQAAREMQQVLKPENASISRLPAQYNSVNGKAIISVAGTLSKGRSWYGTSYDDLKQMIMQADSDPIVDEIGICFDSGGGQTIGVAEVAQAVRDCKKPTVAYISYCCSAAYYIASQCDRIVAEDNALIGSIGTLYVIEDWSKAFENAGIKVEVISSGKYKGMGALGTSLTEEQKQSLQKHVDQLTENFKDTVMAGRNISKEQINMLATGEVWTAKEALNLGLIDEIDNNLYHSAKESQRSNIMSDTKDKAIAEAQEAGKAEGIKIGKAEALSQLDQMVKAFSGDIEFAIEQFKLGATVTEAKAAYSDILIERNAELAKSNAELSKSINAKNGTTVGGADPVPAGKPSANGKSLQELVDELRSENTKLTYTQAVIKAKEILNKENV